MHGPGPEAGISQLFTLHWLKVITRHRKYKIDNKMWSESKKPGLGACLAAISRFLYFEGCLKVKQFKTCEIFGIMP